MRVTTKAIFDIETMQLLEWDGYEYCGPVERCGGGPSPEQKAAAASQANLSNQEAKTGADQLAFFKQQQGKINPFATGLMQSGNPYFNQMTDAASGTNAQAFAPARANLLRSLSSQGSALPSGFRTGAMSDLDEAQSKNYDSMLQGLLQNQLQTKIQGADLLTGQQQLSNPMGWYGQAGSANNSIMQAPLQSAGLGGLLGGIAGGAASAIPW